MQRVELKKTIPRSLAKPRLDTLKREKKSSQPTVDEDALLVVLRQEEMDSATFYASEIAREQAVAADRYFARPYGDGSEVPNRSQVCTHDIQDAINWALPSMMRTFTQAGEDLISVNDDGLDDGDETLQDAQAYLHHVVFKDNPGDEIVHDFLYDGLLQKIGVIRASWEPAEPKPPEVWEGVPVDQLLKIANDKRYRILAAAIDGEVEADDQDDEQGEQEPDGDEQPQKQLAPPQGAPQPQPQQGQPPAPGIMPEDQPQPQGIMPAQPPQAQMQPQGPEPTFTVQVQRVAVGKVRVEVIPPEEFRISRRARSIEEAPYHGWRMEDYLANVIRQHPDRKEDLSEDFGGRAETALGLDSFYDERVTARFPDELDNGVARVAKEPERRRCVVLIEYVRGDFDGDGVVELRRIKRTGDVILENDVVQESEFSSWSPIRVSHRAIGLSVADTLIDIQKIRTVLTRKAMDSLNQALAPRLAISKQAMANDSSLIDRLLDHDVGDVIPVDGKPGEMLFPLLTPDVSASAFTAIEYWDRRSEEASGVNRHAMGIQPEAITDTAKGIDNLQSAANQRIEQYARWAAVGLERVFNKVLRLLVRHQDQPRIVKINGRRMSLDPRRWSDEMTVAVHVGMAAENRERKMQFLGMIAGKQETIMQQAGLDNPLCGPKEYRHTLSQLIVAMGMKSATPFFKEVDNWQPPPAQPDPKQAEAQAKLQLEQQKAQQDAQIKQQQFQADTQMQQAKIAADQQAMAAKADMDRQASERDAAMQAEKIRVDAALKTQQQQAEAALAIRRLQMEDALAREKMDREMELSRFQAAQEVKLRRHAIASQPRIDMPSGSQREMNGGSVKFGGRVG